MTIIQSQENPFVITTPEGLKAEEVQSLFVDVFSDFPKIKHEGHLFLNGPRGCGKSMIFRYLKTDCQLLKQKCSLNELNFISIYVPIKSTSLNLTELALLKKENSFALTVLNEHFMSMWVLSRTFLDLAELKYNDDKKYIEELHHFSNVEFNNLFNRCGNKDLISFRKKKKIAQYFTQLYEICDNSYNNIIQYLRSISQARENYPPYTGPLCGYLDFIDPLFAKLKKLSFLPDTPYFLLIDDADRLSFEQTKILNTWVSTRTSSNLSIKISTQHNYKTYCTIYDNKIDTPHDYSEINIASVYTTSRDKYKKRIQEIVIKRLKKYNIGINDPYAFFPLDIEQENKIKNIAREIEAKWETNGKGFRKKDDSYRYARPEFIRTLGGARKSLHSYSYSGFDQLVHLSSAIIRYFLENAKDMFDETLTKSNGAPIKFIPHNIQNDVSRKQAEDFRYYEYYKLLKEQAITPVDEEKLKKLFNLIDALGGIFKNILFDEKRSERRIFSIAFSDDPDKSLTSVFKLGEQLGYIQTSTIGKKSGLGKTKLYILSRRLAPVYTLDPTGFAGYLFVTSKLINEAAKNPEKIYLRLKNEDMNKLFQVNQLELELDYETNIE